MSHENGGEWLTIPAAARALGISERQARRIAGRLAPDERRGGGGHGPDTTPDNSEPQAGHHAGQGPDTKAALVNLEAMRRTRRAGQRPDISAPEAGHRPDNLTATPDTTPDTSGAALVAVAGDVAQLRAEVEALRAFIAGGALAALSARLESLPDAEAIAAQFEALRADVAKDTAAAIEAATAATGHSTAEAVEIALEAQGAATAAQLVELLAPMAERLAKIEAENAALRAQLASTQRRPWWKFWRE